MGLPEILDAAAKKAATDPGLIAAGLLGASGVGLDPTVDPLPVEMPTTPYAIGYLGAGTARQGTLSVFDDEIEFRVYVPASGLPDGYRLLWSIYEAWLAAWRSGRSLGGLCDDSSILGHGKAELEKWGDTDYLFVPIRIGVLHTAAADLSP